MKLSIFKDNKNINRARTEQRRSKRADNPMYYIALVSFDKLRTSAIKLSKKNSLKIIPLILLNLCALSNNIIFLNGPSSSGKSTIAKELQKQLISPYLHVGVDWFIQTMPTKLWNNNAEGFVLKTTEEKGHKVTQIVAGKEAQKVMDSRYPVIQALLDCNNSLIIDEVITSKEELAKYLKLLENQNVIFIGVSASIDTLRKREKSRGNRTIGTAEEQNKTTNKLMKYDLFIDTNETKPADAAKKIIRSLENHKNRALKKMIRLSEKK